MQRVKVEVTTSEEVTKPSTLMLKHVYKPSNLKPGTHPRLLVMHVEEAKNENKRLKEPG